MAICFRTAVLLLALLLPKTSLSASPCKPSGFLHSKSNKNCDQSNGADCCKAGKSYPQYKNSPPATAHTPAILTLNCFEKNCDDGGAAACDNKFHSDNDLIVALSTGWYNHKSRCGKKIKITSKKNGKSVLATVVDECDSVNGCDKDHDNQPPCRCNVVDASKAVWKALGLNTDVGEESITWSDA
ncbi:Ripening-related protein grip22 [Rhynchospora pubera]|uniref:Ripening-related protein grip22 n=1 Tax=Rhynchospora pubera TaxID=906938 RepID=A0AAV8E7H4_9POAL|nr:Ripening-related protein grip22 [Rhynchospora pubera]